MGTNFYYYPPGIRCGVCGRSDEPEHVGKSSVGWTFSWHGLPGVRSCAGWYKHIEEGHGEIFDEYGYKVSLDELRERVDAKRDATHNHARQYSNEDTWTDEDGCSFSGRLFC